jgi:hypothetical protein
VLATCWVASLTALDRPASRAKMITTDDTRERPYRLPASGLVGRTRRFGEHAGNAAYAETGAGVASIWSAPSCRLLAS